MLRQYRVRDLKKYLNSLTKINNVNDLNALVVKQLDKIGVNTKKCKHFGVAFERYSALGVLDCHRNHTPRKTCDPRNLKIRRIKNEVEKFYLNISKGSFGYAAAAIAVDVNKEATETETSVEVIPEPPPVPEIQELPQQLVEMVSQVNALGEPTFASLGLGGHSPVGIVQTLLEYFHVGLGLDWWATIVLGTLLIRLAMFPLVILSQRNAAKMNNHLPQMQAIQLKMTEARQMGNSLETARYSQELMYFMKEKGLNPFKNMIVPLVQMPIFVSFFMGLRQMANVPVESLREGGLFWFTDLTLPDQYFLLPIITSATLFATIELGTDSARLNAQNMQTMKYVLRAMPLLILPFTFNFPGAILCYWASSNFISLAQVAFLRIPAVREYFKIEKLIQYRPENLPIKPKGFTEGLKDCKWASGKGYIRDK
ncbi:mitochondrial inner membrane protein OXA1L isoform X2 [Cylas formicarius]|uniref:mitochondrial inner membrane protein OXA1L isoform X2 n=1 Tax=Cylas formicarius TaxID=197179 RepID=UPI00295883AD|nr:mitochondrial inner membrane protein OXA1L isoform X2 [Cylas formicarius]